MARGDVSPGFFALLRRFGIMETNPLQNFFALLFQIGFRKRDGQAGIAQAEFVDFDAAEEAEAFGIEGAEAG